MEALAELEAMVMSARRELDELDQTPVKPGNPGYESWLRSHVNAERLSTLGWQQVQAQLQSDFIRWQARQFELLDFLEEVATIAENGGGGVAARPGRESQGQRILHPLTKSTQGF